MENLQTFGSLNEQMKTCFSELTNNVEMFHEKSSDHSGNLKVHLTSFKDNQEKVALINQTYSRQSKTLSSIMENIESSRASMNALKAETESLGNILTGTVQENSQSLVHICKARFDEILKLNFEELDRVRATVGELMTDVEQSHTNLFVKIADHHAQVSSTLKLALMLETAKHKAIVKDMKSEVFPINFRLKVLQT